MLTPELMVPRTLDVNGVPVEYFDSEDDRGRADVLVLVHGTGGSTQSHFGFLYPVLAAKQRVVSVNWAPVGGAQLELDDLVEQVATVIRRVVPDRAVALLGYSLGAVVATSLAAQHAELVQRLIVVSGWLKTDLQQLLRNDVWQALRQQARDTGDDRALREFTTFCAFGGPYLAGQSRAALEPGMAAMQFTAFGDQQMDLNRRIDIVAQAHRVAAPTLVIGCTHDQMVPVRHQKQLFGTIEDSRYAEIPTGHAVVFERPSELSHHVQRFMDAPDAYPAGSIIATPRP